MKTRSYVAIATAFSISLLPATTYGDAVSHSKFTMRFVAGSPVSAGASLTIERDGASNVISGTVSTLSSVATFTFDGSTLRFGDGYGIRSEVLANDQDQYVVKLIGIAPGSENTGVEAVIGYDKQTGRHRFGGNAPGATDESDRAVRSASDSETRAGLDRIHVLLSESHDFAVLTASMPGFTAQMTSTKNGRISPNDLHASPNGLVACIAASLVYIGATLDLIAACGIPEPLEPLACAGAIFAETAAALFLGDSCS
jgi:hypothetical protein